MRMCGQSAHWEISSEISDERTKEGGKKREPKVRTCRRKKLYFANLGTFFSGAREFAFKSPSRFLRPDVQVFFAIKPGAFSRLSNGFQLAPAVFGNV